MNWTEILQAGLVILGVSAAFSILAGNVYYVIRSKSSKIKDEDIAQLKLDFAHCEGQHKDSLKMIHTLQGEINTLKDIPLTELSRGIKNISRTNQKILTTLENSAVTLKRDTKEAKTAVRTVKADLEEA